MLGKHNYTNYQIMRHSLSIYIIVHFKYFNQLINQYCYCLLFSIEKLANLLEELTQHYRLQAQKNIKGQYANQYSAPYFFPKDLEGIYDVGCELKEQQNRDSFDENFKGFIAIVEM